MPLAFKTIQTPSGALNYAPRLVRTSNYFRSHPSEYFNDKRDPDFYDALKAAVEMGVSLPTAIEEQQIYGQKWSKAKAKNAQIFNKYEAHLKGVKVIKPYEEFKKTISCVRGTLGKFREFSDYFKRLYTKNGAYHGTGVAGTLTALRFREADLRKLCEKPDKIPALVIETDISKYLSQIADPKFKRENWKDIINEINIVKDEMQVPVPHDSEGVLAKEMHPVYGIFTEVTGFNDHVDFPEFHAQLFHIYYSRVLKDPISDNYDFGVGYHCSFHPNVYIGDMFCLQVLIDERSTMDTGNLFRPVIRGQVPEKEAKICV